MSNKKNKQTPKKENVKQSNKQLSYAEKISLKASEAETDKNRIIEEIKKIALRGQYFDSLSTEDKRNNISKIYQLNKVMFLGKIAGDRDVVSTLSSSQKIRDLIFAIGKVDSILNSISRKNSSIIRSGDFEKMKDCITVGIEATEGLEKAIELLDEIANKALEKGFGDRRELIKLEKEKERETMEKAGEMLCSGKIAADVKKSLELNDSQLLKAIRKNVYAYVDALKTPITKDILAKEEINSIVEKYGLEDDFVLNKAIKGWLETDKTFATKYAKLAEKAEEEESKPVEKK